MINENEIVATPTATAARMGGLQDATEDFFWQHDLAQKPAHLVIYPYRASSNFQAEILAKLEEANATNQAHLQLSSKEAELNAKLLVFDDDEYLDADEVESKLEVVQGLERVKAKLKELDGKARSANQVIADFFVSIIKSHNLADANLQPLPLTRDGFLLIEPTKFQKLYDDLTSFLSGGKKRPKRP